MSKAINEKRTNSFRRKAIGELKRIAETGSLASAAAKYEIARRERNGSAADSDDEA